jgi:AcrR family transcriptional regulator
LEARAAIIRSATKQLLTGPVTRVTLESVATAAGCAKGLIHYHFKTKDNLLSAAAEQIWDERAAAWKVALDGPDPRAVISAAWALITSEGSRGVSSASAALVMESGDVVVQTVNQAKQRFVSQLGEAADALFRRIGLRSSVPTGEIALLMVAVIDGLGLQVASGTPASTLEPAWHAFWAGILSLTTPA